MSSYHYSDIGARKCVLTGQLANARMCEFFQCYLHKHDFSGRCKKQCANRIRVKRCFIDMVPVSLKLHKLLESVLLCSVRLIGMSLYKLLLAFSHVNASLILVGL